ncbi:MULTISPECIES: Hsp20/alpha crystallin family protein [unclassified Cupriavidus]|uniref:Hsp20/alpha crystallin family protein n=1 Tax=unclassified Cupriavidus TaxID=2640874 RepID=UPI001C00254C|nr:MULTISPECIES: Hsp20/alpha crystallin family protein [unclassified Cupriavidus]MCA3187012.1 Hsp20/alpha crystallin family protein [Cupriavidus sp.]MCA3191641.1 Hsp20/alpha crystallin family protein [Cupriavidus sp.]MCA3200118.1 Hsp20/alpha crystallin family protein [Cupriavidus sp.]MCA3206357.1 Hsp20/alpha crystallin family protein [Cupriavidus sp.]QWE97105.1 Hsp20/alpha crystallin family protein [Cupriavidus sp. EM10]
MNANTQVAARSNGAASQSREDKAHRAVTMVPAVDIVEDTNGVTLWADLPGVSREKLQVSVNDGTLHIEAEAVVPMPPGLRVQHVEVRQPHFARSFSLGPDLDAAQINAHLQDGVLKLTIPRRDEARPRRISIAMS